MATTPSLRDATPRAVVAIDLGGTKLAAALFGADGRPADKRSVALGSRQGPAVAAMIIDEARQLLDSVAGSGRRVHAIGVCVPGVVHGTSGRVWAPNIPGWEEYPLRDELAAALPSPVPQVVVDNDRAASILGEAWQGAARGVRHAVFLAVGTGIGAGILADGRVLDGADGIAGAVGWWALDRPYRQEYTASGCFETHASGDGIANVARRLLTQNNGYGGPLREKPDITARDVFDAAQHGDALGKATLQQAVEFWGMASANLVSLLNPEMIVFGGGVFGPAAQLLGDIAAEARRWAQPMAIDHVRFELSQLGGDAALYGAAYLAMHGRQALRSQANIQ